MVINTSNDLTNLGEKCVRVNSSLLNYIYNSYVALGIGDSNIFSIINKYMYIRYQEEYIIGRAVDAVLMNPVELKTLIDITKTGDLIKNNVKESPITLSGLQKAQDDISCRFRLIKSRECGNIIKSYNAICVQPVPQPSKENLIAQISIENSAQSRVAAEVEKAKRLVLK